MTLTPEQHAELNAWIAENVIGLVSIGQDAEMQERWLPKEIHAVIKRISYEELSNHFLYEIPEYATSPADAMEVLEKCAEKVSDAIRYRVNYNRPDGKHGFSCFEIPQVVAAETLPLAIVLFAKALFEKEAAK